MAENQGAPAPLASPLDDHHDPEIELIKKKESSFARRTTSAGRQSAEMRRNGERGRTSLDMIRQRISSDMQRVLNPAQEEANNYANLAQATRRISMDVKRVSQDSKRPGRTASDMGTPGGPSKLHDHEEGHDHDEHDEDEEPFVPSHGITSAEAAELLEKWGRNELTEHKKPMWLIVFELVRPKTRNSLSWALELFFA